MSNDATSPSSRSLSPPAANTESINTAPRAVELEAIDAVVHTMLAGAQARIDADRARFLALGIIDAEGNTVTDRWPDDMLPGSKTSVETG